LRNCIKRGERGGQGGRTSEEIRQGRGRVLFTEEGHVNWENAGILLQGLLELERGRGEGPLFSRVTPEGEGGGKIGLMGKGIDGRTGTGVTREDGTTEGD